MVFYFYFNNFFFGIAGLVVPTNSTLSTPLDELSQHDWVPGVPRFGGGSVLQ